jgi:site-specific DNA-methyltransferase (adenine-specific)
VQDSHIRDLIGVLQNEESPMGLFITLEEPTRNMLQTAATAGMYESKAWGKFPRIQILTLEELLTGRKPQIPPIYGAFKQAGRIKKQEGQQGELGI